MSTLAWKLLHILSDTFLHDKRYYAVFLPWWKHLNGRSWSWVKSGFSRLSALFLSISLLWSFYNHLVLKLNSLVTSLISLTLKGGEVSVAIWNLGFDLCKVSLTQNKFRSIFFKIFKYCIPRWALSFSLGRYTLEWLLVLAYRTLPLFIFVS